MRLILSAPARHHINSDIQITGSKSESNRLLLLSALFPNIQIENLSNSDDTRLMKKGLSTREGLVDIHHAGTAMRFLTAYFASRDGMEVVLTGSARMKDRPIEILVEALRELGAEIEYLEKKGYPPLRISGRRFTKYETSLPANVSSQYISALLLVAPSLEKGLKLNLIGEITSVPYIKMSCALLNTLGISTSFQGNIITVESADNLPDQLLTVESDWSSASYFYSFAALAAPGSTIRLSSYHKNSLQGDSILSKIYEAFGVSTVFEDHGIVLKKDSNPIKENFSYNLVNAPDLAQTIAVSCFGLGLGCDLTGLHTLKIKETDRLEALKTELTKLGASIETTDDRLILSPGGAPKSDVIIDTYHDHRMAMAFAPLAMRVQLCIEDAGVVSKSYPDFWDDVKCLGIELKKA
ncbi:MAG: 3-phosphoshikimate 1-carboxyvinyltransferase [Flavobacteriaceae bacterium]